MRSRFRQYLLLFGTPGTDTELAAEMYADDVLDGSGRLCHLDKVSSMSAMPEPEHHWDSEILKRQERSFNHGS